MEKKNKTFTNEIAEKFWELHSITKSAAILVFILVLGIAIWIQSLGFFFIGLIMITLILLWTMVFLGASEIIERLQNIENSIEK